MAQVVDAEAFFDIGDFIDDPLEAGLTEPPVLLVFKDLRQVAKLLSGHHVTDRGENYGVFACLVRLVHPDEGRHVLHQGLSRKLIERRHSSRGSEHPIREHAAALVLGTQHGGDVGEFACLFELRKDVLLFQVFVVATDALAETARRMNCCGIHLPKVQPRNQLSGLLKILVSFTMLQYLPLSEVASEAMASHMGVLAVIMPSGVSSKSVRAS